MLQRVKQWFKEKKSPPPQPTDGPAAATTPTTGGTSLRVVPMPTQDMAETNLVYIHPSDSPLWIPLLDQGDEHNDDCVSRRCKPFRKNSRRSDYIRLLPSLILKLATCSEVAPGTIALNVIHRRQLMEGLHARSKWIRKPPASEKFQVCAELRPVEYGTEKIFPILNEADAAEVEGAEVPHDEAPEVIIRPIHVLLLELECLAPARRVQHLKVVDCTVLTQSILDRWNDHILCEGQYLVMAVPNAHQPETGAGTGGSQAPELDRDSKIAEASLPPVAKQLVSESRVTLRARVLSIEFAATQLEQQAARDEVPQTDCALLEQEFEAAAVPKLGYLSKARLGVASGNAPAQASTSAPSSGGIFYTLGERQPLVMINPTPFQQSRIRECDNVAECTLQGLLRAEAAAEPAADGSCHMPARSAFDSPFKLPRSHVSLSLPIAGELTKSEIPTRIDVKLNGTLRERAGKNQPCLNDKQGVFTPGWRGSSTPTAPTPTVFLVKTFLSSEECDKLVAEGERHMRPLHVEFPAAYREGSRALFEAPELAYQLFTRILPHFTTEELKGRIPLCFGHNGVWYPHSCNKAIKINKYTPGGFFAEHRDGPWIPDEDMASIYTFLVYLNDGFQGGETVFVDLPQGRRYGVREQATIQPRKGYALVFNHDAWHSANPVLDGVKYVLRTEVIFHRPRGLFVDRYHYLELESYRNARRLYDASRACKAMNDMAGFVRKYQAFVQLQQRARALEEKTQREEGLAELANRERLLPRDQINRNRLLADELPVDEVLCRVLLFLPESEIVALMRLNQASYFWIARCDVWETLCEEWVPEARRILSWCGGNGCVVDWLSLLRQHRSGAFFTPAVLWPLPHGSSLVLDRPGTRSTNAQWSEIGGNNCGPIQLSGDRFSEEIHPLTTELRLCPFKGHDLDVKPSERLTINRRIIVMTLPPGWLASGEAPYHSNLPNCERYLFVSESVIARQEALTSNHRATLKELSEMKRKLESLKEKESKNPGELSDAERSSIDSIPRQMKAKLLFASAQRSEYGEMVSSKCLQAEDEPDGPHEAETEATERRRARTSGRYVHWAMLSRAVYRCIDCTQVPLVVIEDPSWAPEARRRLFAHIFDTTSVPAIAVLTPGECVTAVLGIQRACTVFIPLEERILRLDCMEGKQVQGWSLELRQPLREGSPQGNEKKEVVKIPLDATQALKDAFAEELRQFRPFPWWEDYDVEALRENPKEVYLRETGNGMLAQWFSNGDQVPFGLTQEEEEPSASALLPPSSNPTTDKAGSRYPLPSLVGRSVIVASPQRPNDSDVERGCVFRSFLTALGIEVEFPHRSTGWPLSRCLVSEGALLLAQHPDFRKSRLRFRFDFAYE